MTDETFQWPVTGGQNYVCISNTASESKELGIGGLGVVAALTLFVERAILPTPGPGEKQRILWKSKIYRIEMIDDVPGNSMIKLICNAATRGV